MTSFKFIKRDANDPRDIGFEIEDAGRSLAVRFDECRAEVVEFSDEASALDWVRVQFRSRALGDCEEAGNWFFAELSERGIVVVRE